MPEHECEINPSLLRQLTTKRRTRRRSARPKALMSLPPRKEKHHLDDKVNPKTSPCIVLFIALPSIALWSARCTRSRSKRTNN
jgi:hypothetical protein